MSTLLEAFDTAVKSSTQREVGVDDAVVEAGRTMAKAIDDITADPDASATDKTKALYLTPHLVSILRELLATPLSRKQVGVTANDVKKASRIANIKDNIRKG